MLKVASENFISNVLFTKNFKVSPTGYLLITGKVVTKGKNMTAITLTKKSKLKLPKMGQINWHSVPHNAMLWEGHATRSMAFLLKNVYLKANH